MSKSKKKYCRFLNRSFIFCISSIFMLSTFAQQSDSTFDLYLLIGQSNMAGRGVINGDYTNEGDPNVFMLDKENKWVPAKHPLHFDKPSVAGVGPGLSFGIEMAKKNHGKKIGLVPCAVGGTSINVWKPGAYDNATSTYPFDDAIKRLTAAKRSGVLKGVLWLQGESDSDPDKAKNYLTKLEELIQLIRKESDDPSLPFVAGELGRYKQQYKNINSALKELPQKISNTAVVSSKGFTDKGDATHFDSPSADKYGKRFAKKMKRLQRHL